MNSCLRPLTSEDSRLFFRFKGNGASNAPGVWLTRGIYIGFSGLDASLCVFAGLMTSLDHRVAMSPQAGAPVTSLQHRFFSGFTGSGIKAFGCQFTGPVCLWREVLKPRTGWRSLLYLESKVRRFAFNIWRLQVPYMTLLNSKGIDHYSLPLKRASPAAY